MNSRSPMPRLFLAAATFMLTSVPTLPPTAYASTINLVTNGDFSSFDPSTGAPANWTASPLGGWSVFNSAGFITAPPGTNYFASTGCVTPCALSQTISGPAGTDTLSFLFNPGLDANTLTGLGVPGGNTQVYWDDTLIASLIGGALEWQSLTYKVPATGSDTLTFSSSQFSANNGLTNISVAPAVAPLPDALFNGATGFGLFALVAFVSHRQRSKKATRNSDVKSTPDRASSGGLSFLRPETASPTPT